MVLIWGWHYKEKKINTHRLVLFFLRLKILFGEVVVFETNIAGTAYYQFCRWTNYLSFCYLNRLVQQAHNVQMTLY